MKKLTYILVLVLLGNILSAQDCLDLTTPINGALNVPVGTDVSWEDVSGVTGYIISLGTSSFDKQLRLVKNKLQGILP